VEVIRHQDIRAEPCAMVRPGFGEALQALVDRRRGENLCAVLGIGRNEVDRISFEKPFETAQALGHEQTVAAVCDRRKKKQKNFATAQVTAGRKKQKNFATVIDRRDNSCFRVNFGASFHELSRLFLHAGLQGLIFGKTSFRRVFAHIFGDLHRAKMRSTH